MKIKTVTRRLNSPKTKQHTRQEIQASTRLFKFISLVSFLLVALFVTLSESAKPAAAMTAQPSITYAAYQEFENGFMVWREDTGEILAFVRSMNTYHRFEESTYAHLPENPVLDTAPHNQIKPIRGFGRVWGNYDYVRDQLGWGIESEYGYTAKHLLINPFMAYFYESITLPTGSTVTYYSDNTWEIYPSSPIAPPSQPPIPESFVGSIQEFENGRMLYSSKSGTIWVLLNSGTAYTYHTNEYGHLPNNPVWTSPPYGYVKPILGFGKVWGNFSNVRHSLGWGTGYEYSYTMTTVETHDVKSIQLPDGQWVKINTVGNWVYQ